MKTDLKDLFFTYREHGICCIPVARESKQPGIPAWKKYQTELPSDDDCASWGAQLDLGHIGIAVVCGPVSNITAIDLDTEDYLQEIPVGGCRKKGKNGETRFYSHSGEVSENIFPRGSRSGIEVKALGHYTVIPPSVHPGTKKPYFWLDQELLGTDLVPLDPAVLDGFRGRWGKTYEDTGGPPARLGISILDLASMLRYINCEELSHDQWLAVAMGCRHECGDEAWQVFDCWCRTDPKRYNQADNHKRWLSFDANGPGRITANSVVHFATQGGWQRGPVVTSRATLLPDIAPIPLDKFLSREIPARARLMGSWLLAGMPFMVAGEAGCGKSMFVYSLAYAVATGSDFFGWKATRAYKVGIFDGEMFDSTIQTRLAGIIRGVGRDCEPANLAILSRDHYTEKELAFPDLRQADDSERILNMFKGVDLLIVDNINSLFSGGNESATEFWIEIDKFIFAARRRNMAVCLVHHTTKTSTKSPAGSSKNVRLVEATMVLEKNGQSDSNGVHFNLSFTKNRELTSDTESKGGGMTTQEGISRWEVGPVVDVIGEPGWLPSARQLKANGSSYRDIGSQLGVPKSSIERALKRPSVPSPRTGDSGTGGKDEL